MNVRLVRRLILKDLYLSRVPLGLVVVIGATAVGSIFLRNEVSGFVGLTSAFIALIMLGNILPMHTIINERKRQTLAFVMSLPISSAEFTAAKILANIGTFFVVWAAVVGSLVAIFAGTPYGGFVPFILMASLAPFAAFCVLVAVSLVGESEVGAMATMIVTNVSYSFIWFFLVRVPAIRAALGSPVPVWPPALLTILAIEISLIVVSIAAAFYFQSRKTNFV
jgi:ABC-type transport system involved in multi-copper enzyme maturation permease subunit